MIIPFLFITGCASTKETVKLETVPPQQPTFGCGGSWCGDACIVDREGRCHCDDACSGKEFIFYIGLIAVLVVIALALPGTVQASL